MPRPSRRQRQQGDGVTTALIYLRVSSDEQAKEGLSLPAQLRECRRYCADRSWVIAAEHQDVLSGSRDDRPGYQALLTGARRLAAEGKHVAVVVMRLDRFGRRLAERIRSREEFKAAGVVTHSVREGGEVSDLMANMLAVLAQEEVERLGDRVRDTRDHNVENGWHTPGRPAWGYRWRPATDEERSQGAPRSVLVPDEITAPYAREMFRMVASGTSPRAVALWAAGLSTEARGTRLLAQVGIRLLLKSPVYVGRFSDGERGRWEPLVDEQTWNTVQTRIGRAKRRSGPISGEHLLTGLIACPTCGSKMAGWTQAGRWKRYRCNSFEHGGERALRNCTCTVSSAPVDEDMIGQIVNLLAPLEAGDPKLRQAVVRAWERLRKPDDAGAKDRARLVARARKEAEDAKRRIAEATRLLVDGTIDRTAYQALAEDEQRRLESAEQTLVGPEAQASVSEVLPPLEKALADLGGWEVVLRQEGAVPQKRAVLALLVERVIPRRISHGKYRADVIWTQRGRALGQAIDEARQRVA